MAAEQAADITDAKTAPPELRGQPKNWQAALVAVEPGTGRILAYFGGKDGAGVRLRGLVPGRERAMPNGFGEHPPGSTFKVYDLATALKRGYSMRSYWDSKSPREFPEADRVKGKLGPIRNASRRGVRAEPCTLIEATTASLNVPFFDLTLSLGPANVLEMARDAGIDYMWDNDNTARGPARDQGHGRGGPDRTSAPSSASASSRSPSWITPTAWPPWRRADCGPTHTSSRRCSRTASRCTARRSSQRGIGLNPQQIDDLNYTLSKVETGRFSGSWDSAGKTGTWQKGTSTSQNSDVWTVGYTKALAAAVWVGTKDGAALKTKGGSYRVFGASYAGPIWRQFMRDAHEAMKFDSSKYQFGGPKGTGDQMPGGAIPSPTPANPFDPCMIPGQPAVPADPAGAEQAAAGADLEAVAAAEATARPAVFETATDHRQPGRRA